MNKEVVFRNWMQNYILDLNLCPFAHQAVNQGKIKLIDVDYSDVNVIYNLFNEFINESPHNIESYFLHIDDVAFYKDFLDVFYYLEDIVSNFPEFENIKLVGFHPGYFHGQVTEEIEHFTNRCPLALVQLINQQDIENRTKVISIESILNSNIKTLKEKGKDQLNQILNES